MVQKRRIARGGTSHRWVAPSGDVAVPGYRDQVEIARSQRAVVFRAWQPDFERHVAIKLLLDGDVRDLERDSLRAAALTGHPNVVTVHEFGTSASGVPYLAMEYLEGGSLGDRLRDAGPLHWPEATHIAIRLAGVLIFAADAGLTDLALTPDHVLMSRFGEPKLLGMGSGRCGDEPSAGAPGLAGLRLTLEQLLTGGVGARQALGEAADLPAALRAALSAPGTEVGDFAAALQAAQADGGVPVTDLGLTSTPAPIRPPHAHAPVLSDATTVAAKRRRQRPAVVLLGLAALALAALVVALRPDRQPLVSTGPAAVATTTAAPAVPGRPLDPPLYAADFTPATGWKSGSSEVSQETAGDGRFHTRFPVGGGRSFRPWTSQADEARLSVSIEASLLAAAGGFVELVCGQEGPGFKRLAGRLVNDGTWQLRANGKEVASGSISLGDNGLGEPFALRLDCTTDQSPTLVSLFLNDTLLGEAQGLDDFPVLAASIFASGSQGQLAEFTLTRMEVRRLG